MNYKNQLHTILIENRVPPLAPEEFVRQLTTYISKLLFSKKWWKQYGFQQYKQGVTYKDGKELNIQDTIRPEHIGKDYVSIYLRRTPKEWKSKDYGEEEQIPEKLSIESQKRGWVLTTFQKRGLGHTAVFSPNYGEQIKPKELYHITSSSNTPRILRIGLIPGNEARADNRHYPDRIYLFTSKDIAIKVAGNWRMSHAMNSYHGYDTPSRRGADEFSVLKVDPVKLKRGTKFYNDIEFNNSVAVWTYSPIPPQALEIIDTV